MQISRPPEQRAQVRSAGGGAWWSIAGRIFSLLKLLRFFLVLGIFLMGACSSTRQASTVAQLAIPTELDLSRDPAVVIEWENRLLANDAKVRADAEENLVQGERRSFPLLRRLLDSRNESLHPKTFKIIQRIGPPA